MSGCSSGTDCPNCGNSADLYNDWKPFDYYIITCPYCGIHIHPKVDYMTLNELNEYRRHNGMTLLRKKPVQDKNIF